MFNSFHCDVSMCGFVYIFCSGPIQLSPNLHLLFTYYMPDPDTRDQQRANRSPRVQAAYSLWKKKKKQKLNNSAYKYIMSDSDKCYGGK